MNCKYYVLGYKSPNGKFWKYIRDFRHINKVSLEIKKITQFNKISFRINNRTVKKFTLRPSKLLVGRPISPDSPSAGIEAECGDTQSSKVLDSPDSRAAEVDNSFNEINDDAVDDVTVKASQV